MSVQNSSSTFVIPIKPYERLVPWKKGEQEATARGISARKHRETADQLWLVKRKNVITPELADLIYAPPSNNPIYSVAMDAIRTHQGRAMQIVLTSTQEVDLESFATSKPGDMYTIQFIRDELIEKGWPHTQVRFQSRTGHILLLSDFSV